ncbi:MAG: hypothetical protein HY320_15885 [Armatimonadetes bacterium]|nr:hypothetical protein [Armatimonadota bacterium]
MALLAAHLPFAAASTLLERLTGIHVGASTVERTAVVIGSRLRAAQQQEVERHQTGRLPEARRKPRRLYVSIDGKMTPLREPWKRDGSAGERVCRWSECKIGVVYEAKPGRDGREAGVRRKSYAATLGDARAFAPLMATVAHQCGHHWAKERIVLGDGAAWIWPQAPKAFGAGSGPVPRSNPDRGFLPCQ